ncbi:MAG: outer membrane beta-barrel protein, partial [Chlamydiota bacterium]|nr:outer membrane beta-barrel protein [Chlamydiota bacterium]
LSLLFFAILNCNLLAQSEGITRSQNRPMLDSHFRERVSEMNRWIHPRLSFQVEYDDNIFFEPTNEKDDFIFTVSPGFLLDVPFSGDTHLFTLDYHADLAAFVDYGDQNFDNHFLLTNLDLNFTNFFIKTYDDFRKTSLRASTEFTERIERFENLYSIDLGSKDWNKLSAVGGYDYFIIRYREDAFDVFDRDEHMLNLTGYYQLRPKTKALLEYNHAFINYDVAARDGDYDQVRTGIQGEIFNKLIATAKIGYQNRRYDDSDQDWSNAVVSLGLDHYFSSATSLSLSYERSARESVYKTNNFYALDLVSATLRQKLFFERLDGKIGFSYQNNNYDSATTEGAVTQERDDDILSFNVGADYAIQDWLLTGVEYTYVDRDSNFSEFDYTDNRVLWKISALF